MGYNKKEWEDKREECSFYKYSELFQLTPYGIGKKCGQIRDGYCS